MPPDERRIYAELGALRVAAILLIAAFLIAAHH
jgi:hypothetical protein